MIVEGVLEARAAGVTVGERDNAGSMGAIVFGLSLEALVGVQVR